MAKRDVIVIGGSAGSITALLEIIKPLPAQLPAYLLFVTHMSVDGVSALPRIIERTGALKVILPQDLTPLRKGRIYLAPSNRHILLEPGQIRVTHDPMENGFRPAIDPLFRSAARIYGARVIGIILSGMLDDGTLGLMNV